MRFFQQLLFAINEGIDVVGGELKSVAMRDGIGGARFHTISAKNASGIINIVDAGVAFARGDALRFGIVGGFDIDTPGRTGGGTEKATDAFFQAVFIAVQNVDAAIASLKMHGLVRVILGGGLSPKIAKGDTEAFGQSRDRAANIL